MPTRVLIVDDRAQDRFLAKRALAAEFADLAVVEAGEWDEFENALNGHEFDVIVTDYQLRSSDGLQVLSAAHAKNPDIPVVMFTQTGSEEIAAAGLKAGLADYIIKTPTHFGRLAHAVRIALQNAASARSEREARQREREALRTAEEALRLKDEFLATLSHELRTPLSAITGWLQIMKLRPDQERWTRGLSAIERNTALLTRLIADLVDVSRIVTGTLTLQVQPTDIRKVVDAALDSVRPDIQAKRLQVSVVGASMLPPVAADPDRLQQVVWNLLSNAVKFTPTDGRITIGIQSGDSTIELSVADNGSGIQAEFLPHVFDRFSQQDGGKTRTHGGMGLGLAIVRHLVEMHRGQVSVKSTEGVGSTFTVRLPLAPAAVPRVLPAATDVPRGQLRGVHVLIVEDDADAREVAGRILEDQGATVASAASAAEGYDALKRARPDVLVCDVGMAHEDGLAFVARLRKDEDATIASIPALAVTAYVRDQDRQQSLQAGFNSHLGKPFSAAELVRIVRHLAHFASPAPHPSARAVT